MRVEDVGFREAVERLRAGVVQVASPGSPRAERTSPSPYSCVSRAPEELAALQAAISLYHQQLLAEPRALQYLSVRGIGQDAIRNHRLGYAAGDHLLTYIRWQHVPLGAALKTGLLTYAGNDFLADRLVIPELSAGRPMLLIGRALDGHLAEDAPKYVGLPGPKPLMDYEQARGSPSVCVVEGAFDILTLRQWGYPAVALLGTSVRREQVDQLRTFGRIYLILDNDDAGLAATLQLSDALGPSGVPVALPDGFNDPADLAALPDGPGLFARSLLESVGETIRMASLS
jgi:DNA primase